MKRMCDFLSRGFACLAVALMILSGLAMPTQGARANAPGGGLGTTIVNLSCSCNSWCGTAPYATTCFGPPDLCRSCPLCGC